MIYLACPYSHPSRDVRVARFKAANKAACKLILQREHVFSPISHTHPIAEAGDLPLGWDYWCAYDRKMLSICNKMIVLMLPGWKESKGVRAEVDLATEMGIPVEFMEDMWITKPS